MMLAGLTSRWTMPFSWAASSAPAIWRAIASCGRDWQRSRGDSLCQRLAIDVLQDESVRSLDGFEPINGADMGMIQCPKQARLTLEASPARRIDEEMSWKNLDRDVTSEVSVPSAVDVAHSTRPDGSEDAVGPDLGAGSQRVSVCRFRSGGQIDRRFAQEALGTSLVFQEGNNLAPERLVTRAQLVEQCVAGASIDGQRRVIHAFYLLPTRGSHSTSPFPHAAGFSRRSYGAGHFMRSREGDGTLMAAGVVGSDSVDRP